MQMRKKIHIYSSEFTERPSWSWSYGSWTYNCLTVYPVPITTTVVSSNFARGDVYSIQHYVVKFVSDMRQVGSFLRVLKVSSTTKTDLHDIAEILLNTVTLKMHSIFIYLV